jgi:hypothetical protein
MDWTTNLAVQVVAGLIGAHFRGDGLTRAPLRLDPP